MANQPIESGGDWQPRQVYLMAAICLATGLLLGYLFRGSESRRVPSGMPGVGTAQATKVAGPQSEQAMPTLEQMKQMADRKAEPLLAQLKDHPKDADLLVQLGNLYGATHQFKVAASYYDRSLQIDPQNVGARTKMASCLYFEGQVDSAIAQLNQSLKYDPRHAGTLFNLGMIKWKGQEDGAGAVAAWQKLLDLYPTIPSDLPSRQTVEKLVAEARQHPGLK